MVQVTFGERKLVQEDDTHVIVLVLIIDIEIFISYRQKSQYL